MNNTILTMKQWLTARWALLLVLLVGQSAVSFADVKLYMEDFSIAAGESKQVSLILDNDKAATVMQVTINLPQGINAYGAEKTSRITGRGATVQESWNDEDRNFTIVETDGNIAAGSGAIITFWIETDLNLSEGEKTITLSDIVISDADAKQLNIIEEATTTVTVKGLKDCVFGAETPEFEIAVGEEYQVDITLANEGVENLSALSGKLTLPAGLEIVPGEDGKFIYSNRTPAPLEFKYQEFEGYTSFVLSSSQNTVIDDTEGIIFSFKVKAGEALAETAVITLSDLRVAATTGKSVGCGDVTINVTNTTAQQLNEDKQTFEDNKESIKAAVDALAQDGDSEATQKLIADAKAAIDATEYDETKTLDENMSVLQAIVENTEDQIAEQRAKDADAAQLEADKAAFKAYKTSKIVEAEGLAQADDPEACASIIADAVSAINSLVYDETKTLEQNKAAADELIAKLKKDLAKERPVQGDITGSGEVDSDDVEAYVDILLGNDENYSGVDLWVINATDTPEQYETYKSLDVNGDGYFDVADAQAILNIAAGLNPDGSLPENSRAFTASAKAAIKAVATAMNGMTRYTLSLDGNIGYSAFQMSVKLEDGMTVANCEAEGVALRTSTAADGTLRIVGMGNGTGSLLTLDVVGDGNVTFANARLATIDAESVSLVVSQTTGINAVNVGASAAGSYDLGGKLQKNVQKGVNIIVGADGSVKKALIK